MAKRITSNSTAGGGAKRKEHAKRRPRAPIRRAAKAKHRVSRAGHAALVESGRRLQARRAQCDSADMAKQVEQFQADLLRDLGPEVTAAQRALAVSAAALFAGLLQGSKRLLRTRFKRSLDTSLDRITRTQTALLRTLTALGLPLDSNRGEAVPTLEDYLLETYGGKANESTITTSAASAETAKPAETTDAEET